MEFYYFVNYYVDLHYILAPSPSFRFLEKTANSEQWLHLESANKNNQVVAYNNWGSYAVLTTNDYV